MAGQHYTENTAIITVNVEFYLYDHHPSLNTTKRRYLLSLYSTLITICWVQLTVIRYKCCHFLIFEKSSKSTRKCRFDVYGTEIDIFELSSIYSTVLYLCVK